MPTTKTELARTLGCSKSTIVNCISEIGAALDGHIARKGKTDVLDDFAASVVADRLGGRFARRDEQPGDPDRLADVYRNAYHETMELLGALKDAHSEQVSAYRAQIEAQQQAIRELTASQERSRMAHEAEVARLNDELAAARLELRQSQACVQELAAAHWWQKRGIVARYALPAARTESIVTGDDSAIVI